MNFKLKIILSFLFGIIILSCTNPFAPKFTELENDNPVIKDQKTIEGVFENFRYAYIFKDTLVYGGLLNDDFTFVYRNYDVGTDLSWGREEDMRTTYGLFQSAQSFTLTWNEVAIAVGDSLTQDISRSFILAIVFSSTDIVNIQGRANFRLMRVSTNDVWKISRWRDESNY